MVTLLAALAGFAAGLLVAAALLVVFQERLAEVVANRHLDRARRLLASGESDRASAELRKIAHVAIPPDIVARLTSRQVAALYRESGLEERVKRFISVFDDLDDGSTKKR